MRVILISVSRTIENCDLIKDVTLIELRVPTANELSLKRLSLKIEFAEGRWLKCDE